VFTSRFLIFCMASLVYKDNPEAFYNMLGEVADQCKHVFDVGVSIFGKVIYGVCLGTKGDWPCLAKV
jgi:hypothetical protein